jgi:hypothetical protein
MVVSSQLHTPVALPSGKEPSVPVGYEAGWAPGRVWTRRRREKDPIISPAGNRTSTVHYVAQSLYWLSYPGSIVAQIAHELCVLLTFCGTRRFILPGLQKHTAAHKTVVGKSEGKTQFERPRHRWQGNIKMGFRETVCETVVWMWLRTESDSGLL